MTMQNERYLLVGKREALQKEYKTLDIDVKGIKLNLRTIYLPGEENNPLEWDTESAESAVKLIHQNVTRMRDIAARINEIEKLIGE